MFGKSADTRYDFTNELNPSTQSDEKVAAVAATATSTAAQWVDVAHAGTKIREGRREKICYLFCASTPWRQETDHRQLYIATGGRLWENVESYVE